MQIPVENIYYLLSYAWNKLDDKDRVPVSIDGQTTLLDLLAKVLLNSARLLLKRGIDRNYVGFTDAVAGVKGKLEISETLKSGVYLKQRTFCSFDDFSPNILVNQILASTIDRLSRVDKLDKLLRGDLKKIRQMFLGIEEIELSPQCFKKVRLNRNSRFYGFVLNVCHLVYENALPSEERGVLHFVDFTRDTNKMNRLFESFVRNFYKLEQSEFRVVKKEKIKWQFDEMSEEDSQFIPQMETDITLESSDRKIIIDAKFYQDTMIVNYKKERIHSSNLYQLFSYLLNQESKDAKTKRTTGILLYPTIEREYNLSYRYREHQILVRTIDLYTDWRSIATRLNQIISTPS